MNSIFKYLSLVVFLFPLVLFSQDFVTGKIIDSKGKTLQGVNIYVEQVNSGAVSDSLGNYFLKIKTRKNITIIYSHIGYEKFSIPINIAIKNGSGDTLLMNVVLKNSPTNLPVYNVSAHPRPDTVFASVTYNVADFEFYKDKLLLLAYKNKLEKDAEVILWDEKSEINSNAKVSFEPIELFRDFEKNINLVCSDTVFKIFVNRNEISLVPINFSEFNNQVKPFIENLGEHIIFSDFSPAFPEFNYYSFSTVKRKITLFKNIIDKPLMREFRYEYYFLPTREKLRARRFAMENNIDKYMVASAMTGFQNSFYYTSLYAPLFVINDSVLIFDHYKNKLYYFDEYIEPVDSVEINYHKIKNEKWNKKLIRDEQNDKIYSIYLKNGFYYLKRIDLKTGKTISSFKLYHKYVEKINIRNDYVYYIFRPFESLQNKFLFKELILSE